MMSDSNDSAYQVCNGATCTCNKGSSPAKMHVVTLNKFFINDGGISKLVATHNEKTVASLNFGTCKTTKKPCNATLIWKDYFKKVIYNGNAYPLLDSSKADCSVGAGEITIAKQGGQTDSVSQHVFDNIPEGPYSQMNPLGDATLAKYRNEKGVNLNGI